HRSPSSRLICVLGIRLDSPLAVPSYGCAKHHARLLSATVITIDLDPNLHFGPITLAWHGIFTAVGIFFGVWLSTKLARELGVDEADAAAVAPWGAGGGVMGWA